MDSGAVRGRVIDVGCGTGELTLLAAARGLHATGVDSSPRAIAIAKERAGARGLTDTRFLVADALDLSTLQATFDTALDSGVFHVFGDEDRAQYVRSIHGVLALGGAYHLLVFSDAVPGGWGPRRIQRAELTAAFKEGWEQLEVESATLNSREARAWRPGVRRWSGQSEATSGAAVSLWSR